MAGFATKVRLSNIEASEKAATEVETVRSADDAKVFQMEHESKVGAEGGTAGLSGAAFVSDDGVAGGAAGGGGRAEAWRADVAQLQECGYRVWLLAAFGVE